MTDDADSGTNLGLDPSVANVARVYDYMLGGKDNFSVDRQLGSQLLTAFPEAAWIARQNRAFAGRAVRYCAEHGVGPRPFVVLLTAILHFITDFERPAELIATFRDAMPSGSYLVLSHATHDFQPEESARATRMFSRASSPLVTRSRLDIAAMFSGFQLVKPGLVRTSRWQPPEQVTVTEASDLFAGVGRKP